MPRPAIVLIFGWLAACSGAPSITFRPITQDDRDARAAYLPNDATALAETRAKSGETLVLVRRGCSRRSAACVYGATLVSGDRGRDLGAFTGDVVAADGYDDRGMPRLRVDGEPCVYLPGPRPDASNGTFTNVGLGGESDAAGPALVPTALSPRAASRAHLHERSATEPYRAFVSTFLPKHADATLVTGTGSSPPFALFSGHVGLHDRELLRQSGVLHVAASLTDGANDLVVERFAGERLFFRYDGTRYVPAACQNVDALRPDPSSAIE